MSTALYTQSVVDRGSNPGKGEINDLSTTSSHMVLKVPMETTLNHVTLARARLII